MKRSKKRRLLAAGALLCVPVGSALISGCGGGGSGLSVPPSVNDIVFASNFQQDLFDLYTIKSDGSNRQQLTHTPDISEAQPSWRPDRRVVAFDSVAKDSRDWDIYILNADGSGLKQLTNNAAIDAQPAFSPDGKKIAFTSNRDGQAEIYLMNADGSGLQRLTTDANHDSVDPAWSPDGKQLAFVKGVKGRTAYLSEPPTRLALTARSGGGITTDIGNIYVMNADGSNVKQLTFEGQGASNHRPAWNPNGQQILFSYGDSNGGGFEIISPTGTNRQVLALGGAGKSAFSPNSAEVIAGSSELYTFKVSEQQPRFLTNDRATDSQAVAVDPDWK